MTSDVCVLPRQTWCGKHHAQGAKAEGCCCSGLEHPAAETAADMWTYFSVREESALQYTGPLAVSLTVILRDNRQKIITAHIRALCCFETCVE